MPSAITRYGVKGDTGPAGPTGSTGAKGDTGDVSGTFDTTYDEKVTLSDNDLFVINDSESSDALKYCKRSSILSNSQMVYNLKPTVAGSSNILDVYTKSGGGVPDGSNPISVAIPDGTGYTFRTRNASVESGTSQIVMADGANYWSKGSLDGEIKTAWLYAIWGSSGLVWALAGYSGFTMVPTTTTATDDDYFLLEDGTSYTRSNNHYCVAVAKIRYQYDTGDTPDHTIQATVINAPQVIWNPKSDYGCQKNLTTSISSGSNMSPQAAVTVLVKQSGKYSISGNITLTGTYDVMGCYLYLRTGSGTYGSATLRSSIQFSMITNHSNYFPLALTNSIIHLNAGDSIHLGGGLDATSGTRKFIGDDVLVGATFLSFQRID